MQPVLLHSQETTTVKVATEDFRSLVVIEMRTMKWIAGIR